MGKKRIIGIALIITIFIGLAATIIYIFTELKDETDIQIQMSDIADSKKFKNEYEAVNNTEAEEGIINRSVSISEDNPIKYVKASDIVSKIDNKESFVVYFGFDTCPWCRLIIETLLDRAKAHSINTIYYVDIKNIRDVYSLNDKNEAVRTTEGTEGYYSLLEKLSNVLDDYEPLKYTETKKVKGKKKEVTVKVPINEKRIYAPNVVVVKNGVPTYMTTGISSDVVDPYKDPTNEEKEYTKNEFDKLMGYIATITTTTQSYICDEKGNC